MGVWTLGHLGFRRYRVPGFGPTVLSCFRQGRSCRGSFRELRLAVAAWIHIGQAAGLPSCGSGLWLNLSRFLACTKATATPAPLHSKGNRYHNRCSEVAARANTVDPEQAGGGEVSAKVSSGQFSILYHALRMKNTTCSIDSVCMSLKTDHEGSAQP